MVRINFLYLILFLTSCQIINNHNRIKKTECNTGSNSTFIDKIKCFKANANYSIIKQLTKSGVDINDCKIIYHTYALLNEIDSNDFRKDSFNQDNFLDLISFSTGFSSFMFLDKSGKYIAKSSDIFTYTNMSQFKFYEYDLQLIEKYIDMDYDIMFELYGFCRNNFVFGYSNDSLEIFEYNDLLKPISFKEFKSKCIF